MTKIKYLIYAAVFTAVLLCLVGCAFGIRTHYLYKDGEKFTAGDRVITEKIETIDIDYVKGDVRLTAGETGEITIRETSEKAIEDKLKVHTYVDGTTLYIRFAASEKRLDFYDLEKQLEITVPNNITFDRIKINMSSGDVACTGIKAETVEAEASSGCLAVNCEAKKIEMKASSGNLTLTQTGESDSVVLETSSGKIRAELGNVRKLSAEASSGTVRIYANAVEELTAETSSGDQEYRLVNVPKKSRVKASSGDVTMYLPMETNLTAALEVSSGDISYEQQFAKRGDSYVCGDGSSQMSIETSSGDITFRQYSDGE